MKHVYPMSNLDAYESTFDAVLKEMSTNDVVARIWDHDHTVWQPDPTEITNRLGWLRIAEAMKHDVDQFKALVEDVYHDGCTDALLLGMGGSSLAPALFSQTFGRDVPAGRPHVDLEVLDSTDPGAVLAYAEALDPRQTVFIVSSKSGTTVETLSFFKFFFNRVSDAVGPQHAGEHFITITDPDSQLTQRADHHHFRAMFLNDPNIGGRYSALSDFGLVPAALSGVDVPLLLDRASAMAAQCEPGVDVAENPGARLGVVIGELANAGRDKLTLVTSPSIASFGDWVEQLIAESTGKDGRGILPVVGEPLGAPGVYGLDRVFVYLRLAGDDTHDEDVAALKEAGHPVIRIDLNDLYDLGGQFFVWEFATAVAGHRLGINPFDQPNVESAKVRAKEMVNAYVEAGELPESGSAPLTRDALDAFLDQAEPGDYVALQAYVQPTPETDRALQALRTQIRDQLKLATTVGYGPRYLHSTGQLHKGDAGNGLFVQFTADARQDAPIPDEAGASASSITFGVLETAQALGDRQALLDAGRRVIHFHLGTDVAAGLEKLATRNDA